MVQTIKSAEPRNALADRALRDRVEAMLAALRAGGEAEALRLAGQLDGWTGPVVLTEARRRELIARLGETEKADIRYAHAQISRFAAAQRASIGEFEVETEPGLRLGQRLVPVGCAGCYVPGGRYAHAASALMSVATARAAGVPFVVAASPPRGEGIAPAVAYALEIAGADLILQLGGVQAIAAMAFGLFGAPPADILAGPGNAFVAEAKRQLFGEVGIDMMAGPTETAIIADDSADPMTVALDLASQAEHGPTSAAWLFTTSPVLARAIPGLVETVAAGLPSGEVVRSAWAACGEVILCDSREEMAEISDRYACEHLQVIARDLDWWKMRLRNYGSLFLGPGSTVAHGDKCSGTNHILPTGRAARYTGGLNVMKFIKVLTWQELVPGVSREVSEVAARISRMEGMEGHARACDRRLEPVAAQP